VRGGGVGMVGVVKEGQVPNVARLLAGKCRCLTNRQEGRSLLPTSYQSPRQIVAR